MVEHKCRKPNCNNKALKKGYLCKSCYEKDNEEKEAGVFDVLLETSKRSKKEHQIFIAFIAGAVFAIAAFGGFIDKVHTASYWYGIFFTIALLLFFIIPGFLIFYQLQNEKRIIELKDKMISNQKN